MQAERDYGPCHEHRRGIDFDEPGGNALNRVNPELVQDSLGLTAGMTRTSEGLSLEVRGVPNATVAVEATSG